MAGRKRQRALTFGAVVVTGLLTIVLPRQAQKLSEPLKTDGLRRNHA